MATELSGNFLAAMPHLDDPNFRRTLILLCEHNGQGAMGVVVNRPLPFTLGQVYQGQGIESAAHATRQVYFGGPVQTEVGFILHDGDRDYPGSVKIKPGIRLGTSMELLRDIASGEGPDNFLFTLGYAGWDTEQLEDELARNDWLVVPFDPALLFGTDPVLLWEKAIRSLGIDPGRLSDTPGNA